MLSLWRLCRVFSHPHFFAHFTVRIFFSCQSERLTNHAWFLTLKGVCVGSVVLDLTYSQSSHAENDWQHLTEHWVMTNCPRGKSRKEVNSSFHTHIHTKAYCNPLVLYDLNSRRPEVREQCNEHPTVQLLTSPLLAAQLHGCVYLVTPLCWRERWAESWCYFVKNELSSWY